MNARVAFAVLLGLCCNCIFKHGVAAATAPCLTQLQVLGTHNSYHQLPAQAVQNLLSSSLVASLLPADAFLPQSWQYAEPSLSQQLDAGVRAFELDLFPDPNGGLYSSPAALKIAGVNATLPDPNWSKPGYKVLHVPDIDFNTSCVAFIQCLTEIKTWSDAHPNHVPITVTLQMNYGTSDLVKMLGPSGVALVNAELAANSNIPGPTSLASPPNASASLLSDLDNEILSIFSANNLITPDSVRAAKGLPATADITQAVLQPATETSCPWPDLDTYLRGKIMFGLNFADETSADFYRALHPNQQGSLAWYAWDQIIPPEAVMYTAGGGLELSRNYGLIPPALPSNVSAIVAQFGQDASDKVKKGYIVRALADQDTVEARDGYVARANAALNSNASSVVSDFVFPSPILTGINYQVKLPSNGQPARCVNNAVLGVYTGPEIDCSAPSSVVTLPLVSGVNTNGSTMSGTTAPSPSSSSIVGGNGDANLNTNNGTAASPTGTNNNSNNKTSPTSDGSRAFRQHRCLPTYVFISILLYTLLYT